VKLVDLRDAVAYRVHVPRWAHAPTSGAGAGMHGGRANRPGVEALYLSLDVETAVQEYQQLSSLVPPGLLTTYKITVAAVADFTDGYDAAQWPPIWEDFACEWRELWFNQHVEPPSWVIGDLVIASGGRGIMFRSALRATGINLVLYTASLDRDNSVVVYDPTDALPKNPNSWL
jgi:RES domain-containing protein